MLNDYQYGEFNTNLELLEIMAAFSGVFGTADVADYDWRLLNQTTAFQKVFDEFPSFKESFERAVELASPESFDTMTMMARMLGVIR